jgi:hypothetical protein
MGSPLFLKLNEGDRSSPAATAAHHLSSVAASSYRQVLITRLWSLPPSSLSHFGYWVDDGVIHQPSTPCSDARLRLSAINRSIV